MALDNQALQYRQSHAARVLGLRVLPAVRTNLVAAVRLDMTTSTSPTRLVEASAVLKGLSGETPVMPIAKGTECSGKRALPDRIAAR